MNKKILIIFPNTANRGRIATVVPTLSGIAKSMGWEVRYFDTAFYDKGFEETFFPSNTSALEKIGAFKLAPKETDFDLKPSSSIIEDLQSILDDFVPDLIAVTVMTCDYQFLSSFWPNLKIPSSTKTIIGGIHAMFGTDEIIKDGFFDIVCTGQGEGVFEELLTRMDTDQPTDHIDGTCFVNRPTGEFRHNKPRRLLSGADLWKFPVDYEIFDHRYYVQPFDGRSVNLFLLEVGRGCPYNCSYCSAPLIRDKFKGLGKYFTTRPIDSIFDTIKQVESIHPVDIYNITHENFLMQERGWVEEFVKRWATDVKKSFFIQTRVETITEDNLTLLKSSGAPIIQIGIGIESGSERILKLCNKSMDSQRIVDAYDLMRRFGIRTNAFFMVGFPTETREDIFDTIRLCKRANADINVISTFQPFPGLPLTKLAIEKGFITGKEQIPAYAGGSIMKGSSMSSESLEKLRNAFLLYAKLPEEYWSDVEKCEVDVEHHRDLFQKLLDLRWTR